MAEKELIFTRKASGLVRELSWWDVLIIAISAPAGSGILYYSVSTASTYPGASIPLSFLIGMLIFLPICAVAAIISATMPRAGSLYVSISRVLDPTIGYFAAFLLFIGYSLSVGVIAYVTIRIIGGILVNSGMASGITPIVTLGTALQTQPWSTIGGILWVVVIWLISISGVRVFRNVMRILFIVTGVATFITILRFFLISPSNLQTVFNLWWGVGAYEKILEAAKANGWGFPTFSWLSTIKALLVVIWAYGGIEIITYASGEVKRPTTKAMRGFMLGWLCVGAIYIALAFSVYRAFNGFIGAYDFLYKNHPDVLKEIMPVVSPSIPFYIASIIRPPWFGITIAISLVLWLVSTMLPYFFGPSRLIFALAMDRAIPERLADVNPRNGAPTWAVHITAIIAIIGVILNLLGVKVVLGTIEFAAFFIFWLYGLSAMLLPFRRPEIYENVPIKSKILGVPAITFWGFLTFAIGWFIVFFTILHMTLVICLVAVAVMLAGMILYFAQQIRNIRRGVDITKIYSQIPPE